MNRRYIFYMIIILSFVVSGCNSTPTNASMVNALDIQQDISQIKYVGNCNVLCTNTTALINIDFKNHNDMNYVSQESLKKSIKDIVRYENSNIKNIFITSDENVSKKIQNIMSNFIPNV